MILTMPRKCHLQDNLMQKLCLATTLPCSVPASIPKLRQHSTGGIAMSTKDYGLYPALPGVIAESQTINMAKRSTMNHTASLSCCPWEEASETCRLRNTF